MANTQYIKSDIEPWVRSQLQIRFGQPFESRFLPLSTGAKHEFDAVSTDGAIVISIKSASGLTSGGNLPQGKFHNAIAEIFFLSLATAPTRVLLTTNPSFYKLLEKRIQGLIPHGVTTECLPLPPEMQAKLDIFLGIASKEVAPQIVQAAVEDELD
jgi:hypothetical protein